MLAHILNKHSRLLYRTATLMGLAMGVGAFMSTGFFSTTSQADETRLLGLACQAAPLFIERSWPDTDFSRCTVPLNEIISGGPGKDGIRSIDSPEFEPVGQSGLADNEPVITVTVGDETRIYPLQILTWHEIVNDEIAGTPVAVTYCPLCNASIVFDRRLNDRVLDFGTTGNLRLSDLVMYDRQTESWFQQYTGTGLFGALAGQQLEVLPARLESVGTAKAQFPDSRILVPPRGFLRPYGANPYVGYDTSPFPFLFNGDVPQGVKPLEYVVIADDRAWALSLVQEQGRLVDGEIELSWQPGRASALDSRQIADGRDLGNVIVKRITDTGKDLIPYKISFAFVWYAFNPEAEIIRQANG